MSDSEAEIELAEAAEPSLVKRVERQRGIDLVSAARELETASAEERVAWGLRHFKGQVALSSSFGAQAAVSLHLATRLEPDLPVILIDTGYLFPETYQFIDELTERLELNLKVYRPELSAAWQEARYGKLWEKGLTGIERYNLHAKSKPMDRALEELGVDLWMAGLRRVQSSTRKALPALAVSRERLKLHPIIDWSDKDIYDYLIRHDLPYHPLWEEGYVSIGDWHTSHKLKDGMSEEETRFFGLKRECGLHENDDYVI